MATWIYSGNVYDASPPGTTDFVLTTEAGNVINYLQRSHIHVYKSVDSGATYTELSFNTDYAFNTEGTVIILNTGIAAGEWIKLLRITPYQTEYVEYQASSQLTASQLNTGERFSMYVDQELYDDIAVVNEGFISEAPQDSKLYGRENAGWTEVPPPGISDAPQDSKTYGRNNQSWVEVTGGGGGSYVLPIASATVLGGIKVGANLSISGSGVLSATGGGGGGGGLVYKGTADLTLAAPSVSSDGDFFVNTATSGVVDQSWTGLGGTALVGGERVAYDGSVWQMIPGPPSDGVTSLVAGNNITINSTNPKVPVVSVTPNSFLTSVIAGQNITVTGSSTVGVTADSFIPYDFSSLPALP